ncbi:MAG: hypothetical protein H7336_08595 [Bacteriovorax sp.]|nr:hypothetical protein [Bacteriovorax sp.]
MENKKQLIIIPPMSEAVKKLHEVLEGVAADENMEITLIDDLKELTQFLGNTGQCLILVSNAKKCATFLQENRFFLLKNHCKTILFSPKEIPAKTLVKFTKIGLTESILESSPPKTFLYKVKLLLRSIKTAKVAEDAEKIVKSLDNIKAVAGGDLEVKEKIAAEENVIDMERPNKKDQGEGETIDYGNPLKGKVKPGEDSIDTHWKSDRKKSEGVILEDEEDLTTDSTKDAIDMYMRGKSKATQAEPEEDDFDKKMAELLAAEEEAKKKSNFSDIIEEGSMKQKRVNTEENYETEEEKKALVELDLISAKKRKEKKNLPEEEDDFDKKMAELLAAEAEAKKKNEGFVEDLGYIQGKLSAVQPEEAEEEEKNEKKYDNSELEEDKPKSIELDLIAAEKKKDKKNIEPLSEEGKVHESEVDQIEGNMIGDEGTVDKIRTRMEGRSSYDENPLVEEENDNPNAKKKKPLEEEANERELDSLEITLAGKETKKRETLRAETEAEDSRKKSIELDLIDTEKKPYKKQEQTEAETRARKSLDSVEEVERQRKALDKTIEAEKKSRESGPGQEAAKKDGNNVHNSTVDKIDTFYRGGEAAKKKDHDWGNLVDKKDSFDLLPGKSKRSDEIGGSTAKADLGEQTIDYRKMKEEFAMMAGGTSADAAARAASGDTTLKNDEDEGSFKVIEIDPKSLDFSISIINNIYQKDVKPKQIFALLADELVNNYHCYPIFYIYKLSDKKFTEVFNPYMEIKDDRMNEEKRAFWNEFKKDTALFEHFQDKSMTTWRCPEIVNNNEVWEDVELPSWAENELKSKKVELIFPYFDGIDRMGLAVVLFPDGLDPKNANGLLTVLEMARVLFLDTIQRYQVQPIREERKEEAEADAAPAEVKKNVLSFFGGLFGKKKAG